MTLLLLFAGAPAGLNPAPVNDGDEVPGPAAPPPDPRTLRPGSVVDLDQVPGPKAPPIPALRRPLAPYSVPSGEIVPGPWMIEPPPTDPTVPTIPAGPTRVIAGVQVVGYPDATAITATPAVNAPGGASFTCPQPGPAPGEIIGVNVSGRRILTGVADKITTPTRAVGDEAAQLVTVTVDGMLAELGEALVLPDLAASDVTRLGPPTQDSRVFDWTMNGLGNESFGEQGVSIIPSVSLDATRAALENVFQLPDVWPDPTAKWMWVTNPRNNQPRGWCHFRIATKRHIGRMQLWACAYDYAEVWMDGVPLLVCDQPGVAQHVEIESRYDYHLLTIKAYNERGRAGVMCSLLPVLSGGQYGTPTMNSRSNWKALAYPTRTFISTPGQVMYRLRWEAARRGLWPLTGPGSWQFDFTELLDSAGRSWDRAEPITLDVGMDMLGVLDRLAESRIDYAAAPAQRRLRMWMKDRGTGHAVAAPWTADVDMVSEATQVVVR